MKRVVLPAMVTLGFAAGWSLPSRPEQAPVSSPALATAESSRSAQRKRALLERLLDENELADHRSRTASLSGLLAMGRGHNYTEEEITRLATTDPGAALDELLTNPIASSRDAERIVSEWARRQPEEAIRYLLGKKSYRADDCLAYALAAAYLTHPKLVGEVLRSKSRDWQDRHLLFLFQQYDRVREPGAPPEPVDDPFFDDGRWSKVYFGTDLLDCLADDELRERAKSCWKRDEEPQKPREPETWDPATYEGMFSLQSIALDNDLREKPAETIARIVEKGNLMARQRAMESIINRFPNDPQQWSDALEKLEASIEQLGVIPEQPPAHFEQGPFLRGPEVTGWLERQPLALQRAWAPSFVETWAESDAQPALEWARALPENAARDKAFQTGLIVWTHRDPLAAADYLNGLPAGELREAAISNAAATWDCIDPAAARQWVAGLPESPGQQRALERLKR